MTGTDTPGRAMERTAACEPDASREAKSLSW